MVFGRNHLLLSFKARQKRIFIFQDKTVRGHKKGISGVCVRMLFLFLTKNNFNRDVKL